MWTLSKKPFILLLPAFFYVLCGSLLSATVDPATTCYARLANGELNIGNNLISRTYRWNDGDLISTSLTDKQPKHLWSLNGNAHGCILPGSGKALKGDLQNSIVPINSSTPAYLAALALL